MGNSQPNNGNSTSSKNQKTIEHGKSISHMMADRWSSLNNKRKSESSSRGGQASLASLPASDSNGFKVEDQWSPLRKKLRRVSIICIF